MSSVRLSFLVSLLFALSALTVSGCDKSTQEEGGSEAANTPAADEGEASGEGEAEAAPEAAASDNPCQDYYEAVSKACTQALRGGLEFNCGHALVELRTLHGLSDGDFAAGQASTCRSYLEKVNKALGEDDGEAVTLERDCATMADALEDRCLDTIASGEVAPGCEMPIKTWSTMSARRALDDSACQTVLGMLPDE